MFYSFHSFEPVSCSISGSKCCFLICIQVSQEIGKVVWYSHLFKNFPVFAFFFFLIHTVKGFSIDNKAEVGFSCILFFFLWSIECCNLICGSSAFSLLSLYIWKLWVCVLLKPSLKDFEYNFASMCNERNCMMKRREWETTPAFLLWEPHGEYQKEKWKLYP